MWQDDVVTDGGWLGDADCGRIRLASATSTEVDPMIDVARLQNYALPAHDGGAGTWASR